MKYLLFFWLTLIVKGIYAQENIDFRSNSNDLGHTMLMIGENPKIRYLFQRLNDGSVIFDASPNVIFPFYNDIRKFIGEDKKYSTAIYLNFRPQIRMYNLDSKPVRTPSYRIHLGYQGLYRISNEENHPVFGGVLFETGHYSNGQSGCAFSSNYLDQSYNCDSIYSQINENTDLSQILNRQTGNFSTNNTEISFWYRNYRLGTSNGQPILYFGGKAGINLYHKNLLYLFPFGGYSENDKNYIGRQRINLQFEFFKVFALSEKIFLPIEFEMNYEKLWAKNNLITKYRIEPEIIIYPIPKLRNLGFSASFIHGFDSYNFRLVDKISTFTAGIRWEYFLINDLQKFKFN